MLQETIPLWGDGEYPDEWEDGFRPALELFLPAGGRRRAGVLICPGGGYAITADREAEPVALRFAASGFHAFVLRYSVAPRPYPQPLLDLARAMVLLRQNADQWGLNPNQIAVCGFSAGGHLAANLGVNWSRDWLRERAGAKPEMLRPNALILGYPLITTGETEAIRSSWERLLGEHRGDAALLEKAKIEPNVDEHTPPSFVWHTFEDETVPVEHSMLYTEALRKHGVPFELHIYPEGRHGLSIATKETNDEIFGMNDHVASWTGLCVEWLEALFA